MGNITPDEGVSRNCNLSAGGTGRADDCSEEKCGQRDAGATKGSGRSLHELPGKKMVAVGLGLNSADGYRDEGDHAQRRQAEVDVYVGEQPALGDDIILKELQCTQGGIAAAAAVAVNQSGILREGGASGGVQTIGDVQEARGMQSHAAIEQDSGRGDTKCIAELAHEEVGGGNVIDVGDRRTGAYNVSGSEDNGPDAKALQENYGRQDDGGGGGRPDIADREVGANQEQQSADERAHGT